MQPSIVIQLPNKKQVDAFRLGLGDTPGVIPLAIDAGLFSKMAGLDALYMSLTRAERWGSRPLVPYEIGVLTPSVAEQEAGMPPFIFTGLVLKDSDPNSASFAVPIIVESVLKAAEKINSNQSGSIRTIGFFEYELKFPHESMQDVGRSFAKGFLKHSMATTRGSSS